MKCEPIKEEDRKEEFAMRYFAKMLHFVLRVGTNGFVGPSLSNEDVGHYQVRSDAIIPEILEGVGHRRSSSIDHRGRLFVWRA